MLQIVRVLFVVVDEVRVALYNVKSASATRPKCEVLLFECEVMNVEYENFKKLIKLFFNFYFHFVELSSYDDDQYY